MPAGPFHATHAALRLWRRKPCPAHSGGQSPNPVPTQQPDVTRPWTVAHGPRGREQPSISICRFSIFLFYKCLWEREVNATSLPSPGTREKHQVTLATEKEAAGSRPPSSGPDGQWRAWPSWTQRGEGRGHLRGHQEPRTFSPRASSRWDFQRRP